MSAKVCNIYRSGRKEGMYLYVNKADELKKVPEALLDLFGAPVFVTAMLITPDKKMARANAADLLADIDDKGFYLQMPPPEDDSMREIAEKNTKIQR